MVAARILVVDDEKLIRWTLQDCLERAGFETVMADCGKAALRALEDRPVDLTLLDYKLPDVEDLNLWNLLAAKLIPEL